MGKDLFAKRVPFRGFRGNKKVPVALPLYSFAACRISAALRLAPSPFCSLSYALCPMPYVLCCSSLSAF